MYLCCLESIQNAAKHAGRDARMTVTLRRDGNELVFSLHDTGRGFNPQIMGRGAGLTSIQDRIDTVGGRVEIVSAPGAGTTVAGLVPWPARTD
jgi:signal transduction histidine kinase